MSELTKPKAAQVEASPPIDQASREPEKEYQPHAPSNGPNIAPKDVHNSLRRDSDVAVLQQAEVSDQPAMNGNTQRPPQSISLPGLGTTLTPHASGKENAGGQTDRPRSTVPTIVDFPMANAAAPPIQTPPVRGRPIGRPRGSRARGTTRASTRGGRGGKRKRNDDEDDGNSSDSEIITPTAHTTKSGRNVQKPTTFVPPPQPSPQATPVYKKKKPAYRKNPESAVCKVCLRGVSPASNMIVFCDGCNTPYHQWCHQPPIDRSVIEQFDKEWFCRPCERERIQPVPEAEILGFVVVQGVSAEERQKYFSSLPPGLLVTLLTRATTLRPDLPVFDPTFKPKSTEGAQLHEKATINGASHAHAGAANVSAASTASTFPTNAAPSFTNPPPMTSTIIRDMESSEDGYGSDEHPSRYPRPGHGLMSTLPPESEDLHYLVDDDNSRGVFTHLYQVEPEATTAGAAPGS